VQLRDDQGRVVVRVPLTPRDRVHLAHAEAVTLDITALLEPDDAP
jgi:hypothetical protein